MPSRSTLSPRPSQASFTILGSWLVSQGSLPTNLNLSAPTCQAHTSPVAGLTLATGVGAGVAHCWMIAAA